VHLAATIFLGVIALAWLTYGIGTAYGALRLPRLENSPPAPDSECAPISLLFAARDEEEKLPDALASLAALDYPSLEIVAVDDRSQDATGRLLDEFAARNPRARVIHVKELPAGWLGKPHALEKAYQASRSEWLLFTDADVRFAPETLRRAMKRAQSEKLDHLTLVPEIEMVGFWEKVIITFFSLGFHLRFQPFHVSNPRSRRYAGVGAFQLVRRTAYEAAGTHRRLAMEVLDDMKLGMILKQAGFRSAVGLAIDSLSVRWHAGPGSVVRGVTKNFFAAANFSLLVVAVQLVGILTMDVAPFAALIWPPGWARAFAGTAVLAILAFHAGVAITLRVAPLYALTHPIGALILCYMLLRSTVVTLRHGGITWRGTFYSMEELKRGIV